MTPPSCPICGGVDFRSVDGHRNGACGGCGAFERQRGIARRLARELRGGGNARCLEIAPLSPHVFGDHLRSLGWHYESVDKRHLREQRGDGTWDDFIDYDRDPADLFGVADGRFALVLRCAPAEGVDDAAALDEVARVLAPRGRALLEFAPGSDVDAALGARFGHVATVEVQEGEYRGIVYVCRPADQPSPELRPGRQLQPVSIADIATAVTVKDPAWTGDLPFVAVSRGSGAKERVSLRRFSVEGDPQLQQEHPQRKASHAEYAVRRIFMMSLPHCALVGPFLVATMGDRYVSETVRGPKSFARRSVFTRGPEGWPRLAEGVTEVRIEEPVAAIGGRAVHNYFHWMTDMLPRLLAIKERGRLGSLPVVLRPVGTAFGARTLEWLGLETRPQAEDVIRVPRAVIPSFPVHAARGARYSSEVVSAARRFRDHYVPACDEELPARFFVSRRDAGRGLTNDLEVEARLAELGIATVVLSELELHQQVALFARAELVVGQHGAGLANLLFAPEAARVVELVPAGYAVASPYWTIASHAGLDYVALACRPAHPDRENTGAFNQVDLEVDLEALMTLLQRLEVRRSA